MVTPPTLEFQPCIRPTRQLGVLVLNQDQVHLYLGLCHHATSKHLIDTLDLHGVLGHRCDHDPVGLVKTPSRPVRLGRVTDEQQEAALRFLFLQPGRQLVAY